jgi:phenylacetate-CoA ligase
MSDNPPSYPKFLDSVETLPRAELRALQWQRLQQVMPYAYENSALIRAVWQKAGVTPNDIRTLDDYFANAPFIDKDMIRDFRSEHGDPFGGVMCDELRGTLIVGSTSGTTGDPTLLPTRWENKGTARNPGDCWEAGDIGYWRAPQRDHWEAGVRPGEYCTMFAPTMRGPAVFGRELGMIPILFDHNPMELARFCELARTLRPTLFYILSTPLINGFEQLERETGIDLKDVFSSFKVVYFGGEPLSVRARALVERWGIPLREHSSLGDIGTTWECSALDGQHTWEDLALVEYIDPETGRHLDDESGRGELVVTALANPQTPLLRFRSGDLAEFTFKPCLCGRTHGRMSLLGRAGDEIICNGKVILPRDVWTAVESVEETSAGLFQIIRPTRELTELKLRVGYAGSPDLARLAEKLADSVEQLIGIRPQILLTPNEELAKLGPPHKIPRVAKS